MPGHHLIIQHLILTGAGVKPTVPNPATLTPDDAGWVANSDILIGQHAYNRTDNKWYFRSGADVITELASGGHAIQSNGTAVAAQQTLNFTNGLKAVNSGQYPRTEVFLDPLVQYITTMYLINNL